MNLSYKGLPRFVQLLMTAFRKSLGTFTLRQSVK